MNDERPLRVWDPLLRTLHWALAASVALAWATTEWLGRWHQPAGYAALAIVAARIVWGVAGGRYARFAQFVRTPRATWRYTALALTGREPRYLGHNPLGACMVIALFACIVALGLTGWLYRTDRFWGDETVERIHQTLAWTLLALVVLHVLGVAFASWRHRENLIVAMLDGQKRRACTDDIA